MNRLYSLFLVMCIAVSSGLVLHAADYTDVLPNPTNSGSYSNMSYTGSVSGAIYFWQKVSHQSGFFQIRQLQNSYFTVQTPPEGKVLKSISITSTASASVKIYQNSTAYSAYTTSPAGKLVGEFSSAETMSFGFVQADGNYFYVIPGSTSIVKIKDIKITWTDGVVEEGPGEYNPGWGDVSLQWGTTHPLNLGGKHPELSFSSSDAQVATVSSEGVITAVKPGTATVTASWEASDDFKAGSKEVTVTVTRQDAALSFPDAQYRVDLGRTFASPLVNPNNLSVSWSSNNAAVATVGTDGTVTPVAVGETRIRATFTANDLYNGTWKEYLLRVYDPDAKEYTLIEDVIDVNTLNPGTSYNSCSYTSDATGILYKAHVMKTSAGALQTNTGHNIVVAANNKGYVLKKIVLKKSSGAGNGTKIFANDANFASNTTSNPDNKYLVTTVSLSQGEDVEYEFTSDYKAVAIASAGSAIYYNYIKLYWADPNEFAPKVPAKPVFSIAGGEVEPGTEVTVSSEGAESLTYTVTYTAGDKAAVEQTVEGAQTTVTIDDDCTITAKGTNKEGDSQEAVATYTVNKPRVPAAPLFAKANGYAVAEDTEIAVTAAGATSIKIASYTIDGRLQPAVETAGAGAKVTVDRWNRRFVAVAVNTVGESAPTEVMYNILQDSRQAEGMWKRLTSLDQLRDGMEIVFVGDTVTGTKTYRTAMGLEGASSGRNNRNGVDVEIAEDLTITEMPEGIQYLTLQRTGDKWAFRAKNADGTWGYMPQPATPLSTATKFLWTTGEEVSAATISMYEPNPGQVSVVFDKPNDNEWNTKLMVNYESGNGVKFHAYAETTTPGGTNVYQYPYIYFREGGDGAVAEPLYTVSISHGGSASRGVRALAAGTAAEVTVEEGADGKLTYTTASQATLAGQVDVTMNGDRQFLAHPDANADMVVSDFHSHDSQACSDEHEAYVKLSQDSPVQLTGADTEGAMAISTHTNVYHGFTDSHNNAVATVTLDPFKSMSLSLASDGITTVRDIAVDTDGADVLYNLQGVRVQGTPAPGLYISVRGGQARRVIIR